MILKKLCLTAGLVICSALICEPSFAWERTADISGIAYKTKWAIYNSNLKCIDAASDIKHSRLCVGKIAKRYNVSKEQVNTITNELILQTPDEEKDYSNAKTPAQRQKERDEFTKNLYEAADKIKKGQ